jgi:nucleotide-binding universal stress UspA family protein
MPIKILIALDYNPSAQKIAETGFAFTDSMDAEITLLHVVRDAAYYASPQYSPIMGFGLNNSALLQMDTVAQIKEAAQQFLDHSKKHLGNEAIHTLVKEGDPARAILDAAHETNADFIMMGTHSRKGIDKLLMGSVAESVLRHTIIPVFIIPIRKQK